MNNQILSVQTGRISQISTRQVFKEGDSVFVKVLGKKSNGSYIGSVAGNRVTISSSRELPPGSSFIATISSKNGIIYISPKNVSGPGFENTNFLEVSLLQNSQIEDFLSKLGVPASNLTENLLKMMIQLEMKVDGNVLKEIYRQALKHKGKEKAAGELLMIFKDKGINISPEELEELLNYLNSDISFYDNFEKNNNKNQFKNSKNIINKNNENDKGWILIPYNLVKIANKEIIGAGVIRVLFDKNKNLKMINLNCYFNEKEYIFSMAFEMKNLKNIKFSVEPEEFSPTKYEEKFKKYFSDKNIEIQWVEKELIENFASEIQEVYSFRGEA